MAASCTFRRNLFMPRPRCLIGEDFFTASRTGFSFLPVFNAAPTLPDW
jgi:hypothetical protein